MRRTNPPRAIAVARQADGVRPAAIFGALGLITLLILAWTSLVL